MLHFDFYMYIRINLTKLSNYRLKSNFCIVYHSKRCVCLKFHRFIFKLHESVCTIFSASFHSVENLINLSYQLFTFLFLAACDSADVKIRCGFFIILTIQINSSELFAFPFFVICLFRIMMTSAGNVWSPYLRWTKHFWMRWPLFKSINLKMIWKVIHRHVNQAPMKIHLVIYYLVDMDNNIDLVNQIARWRYRHRQMLMPPTCRAGSQHFHFLCVCERWERRKSNEDYEWICNNLIIFFFLKKRF